MSRAHVDPEVRVATLDQALHDAMREVADKPTVARRLTLARIAREAGDSATQTAQLRALLETPRLHESVITAPFLNAHERYDTVFVRGTLGEFILSQVLEAALSSLWSSTYFARYDAAPLLDALANLPYSTDAIRDRQKLLLRSIRAQE
jgi:hypothetical protein